MTAGHCAFRGSGPGKQPAFDKALANVGCPDRRICITCWWPSQPSHHGGCPARSRYAASDGFLIALAFCHHQTPLPTELNADLGGVDNIRPFVRVACNAFLE